MVFLYPGLAGPSLILGSFSTLGHLAWPHMAAYREDSA